VKSHHGAYLFEVVRVKPRKRIPDARQRRIVRLRLVAEAEQHALDAFFKDFNAKWTARTTCAPAFVWLTECANHV
jgi:hypothetical protein